MSRSEIHNARSLARRILDSWLVVARPLPVNYTRVRRRIFRPVCDTLTQICPAAGQPNALTVCDSLVNSDMSFFIRVLVIYSKSRCTASERGTRAFKTRLSSSSLKGFSERLYSHSSVSLLSGTLETKNHGYVWVMVIILSDWLRRALGWVFGMQLIPNGAPACIHKKNVAHISVCCISKSHSIENFFEELLYDFIYF